MRWLVVGANGMLGQDLTAILEHRGERVVGVDRDAVDITDGKASAGLARGFDVVVNCAAHTAVDRAEEEEAAAFAVNAVGAANVARACRVAGARLVHISTDYVFDGSSTEPYAEHAPLAPRRLGPSVGRAGGQRRVLGVRLSTRPVEDVVRGDVHQAGPGDPTGPGDVGGTDRIHGEGRGLLLLRPVHSGMGRAVHDDVEAPGEPGRRLPVGDVDGVPVHPDNPLAAMLEDCGEILPEHAVRPYHQPPHAISLSSPRTRSD